jgi:hypothetical protein
MSVDLPQLTEVGCGGEWSSCPWLDWLENGCCRSEVLQQPESGPYRAIPSLCYLQTPAPLILVAYRGGFDIVIALLS